MDLLLCQAVWVVLLLVTDLTGLRARLYAGSARHAIHCSFELLDTGWRQTPLDRSLHPTHLLSSLTG